MYRSALRPLTRTARQFSTKPLRTPPSRTTATALVSLSLVTGTIAFSSSRSRALHADGAVRQSVLDQPTLKGNIHKRDGSDQGQDLIEGKNKEAQSEGAFNEETGEINWDCPCLGGMADGPCGDRFKDAFSCFVFSEADPKGMDCVDKFKNMQDCFREHPDIYGEEIADDDDEPSREDEHPVSGSVKPGTSGVPKSPNKNPPRNSPTLGASPENTMTKNTNKLHLTRDRSRHIPNFDEDEQEKGKK